jgi:hypothetical protein
VSNKLIPEKTKRIVTTLVRETSASTVLDDALSILNNEIQRFRVKSSQGFGLDVDEAKVLRTYVQSLVDLSREQRAQEEHDGLQDAMSKMSDDELLLMYQEKLTDTKKP